MAIGQDIWAFLAILQEDVGGNQMRSKSCSRLIKNQELALQRSAGNLELTGWTQWVFRARSGHSVCQICKVKMAGSLLIRSIYKHASEEVA